MLYTWEPTTGRRFVTGAARIADIAFVGADAVVTDAGSDQVLLIRGVRDQAAPALVADLRDGVNRPGAIAVSSRNEIYIGVAEAVLVMGLLAGYYRGWVDNLLTRVSDIILSFPVIILYMCRVLILMCRVLCN